MDISPPCWIKVLVAVYVTGFSLLFIFFLITIRMSLPRKANALAHKVKHLPAYDEVSALDDYIIKLIDRRKHIVRCVRREARRQKWRRRWVRLTRFFRRSSKK